MAPARLHQHGQARLGLDHQLQPALLEVRAMIPTRALGEVHALRRRWLVAVRAPLDRQAGAIELGKGRGQSQTLCRGGGHEPREFRDPGVIQGSPGTPEGIIIALCGGNTGRHEARGGLVLAAPGDEGERLVDNPQASEHHGFDGLPSREVAPFRVLVGGVIADVADAEFVEHARNKAEVIQDLATVRGLVGHNHRLCG